MGGVPKVPFKLDVPFIGGLDEVNDSTTQEPPLLLRADNAVFHKNGSIRRRPGMTAVGATGLTGQRANCIFEHDGGANVLTDQGVYARSETGDKWLATNARGIRPCQVDTRAAVRPTNDNVYQPDSAYVNGYVATVWSSIDLSQWAVGSNTRCYVQVVEKATGAVITPPTQLPSTLVGLPHVVGIDGNFVVVAANAAGNLQSCYWTPNVTSIPTSATTFTGGLVHEIYDVDTNNVSSGSFFVVSKTAAKQFNVWALSNTGSVTASKTAITANCDTSIRGICVYYSNTSGVVRVAYVDGVAGGALTDSQLFFGNLPANLTTYTETSSGTVHGNFSPRAGANGPSLAYADMAIGDMDVSGATFIAWSCTLAIGAPKTGGIAGWLTGDPTGYGDLVAATNANSEVGGLTANTNTAVFEANGSTLRNTVGTTRGYRLVSRASKLITATGAGYVALGYVGLLSFAVDSVNGDSTRIYVPYLTGSGATTVLSGGWPSQLETLFPAMVLCQPISGPSYDSQGNAQTGIILSVVARFNRDVAYSYIPGSGAFPSMSALRQDTSTTLQVAEPVERTALRPIKGIFWEANATTFDFAPRPARKIAANGGVYLDGGYDGSFDGAESFESSLHQPPDAPMALLAKVASTQHWGTSTAVPNPIYYIGVAFTWEDMDGNLHRSAISPMMRWEPGYAHVPYAWGATGYPILAVNDPAALYALEGYGRNNVRIQVYANQPLATDSASSPAGSNVPVLLVDDVVGADTSSVTPLGTTIGYKISRATSGLVVIKLFTPYVATYIPSVLIRDTATPPHYSFGGVLPAEPSHALADLTVWGDRLVGIDAEDKLRLPYTKPFEQRVAPEWNGDLSIRIPSDGGDCIALAVMDEKLVVLKQSAIYVVVGDCASATGQYEQLSVQKVASDVGCSERNSVAVVPDGLLFISQRGPVLLDRGLVIRRTHSMPDTLTACTCALVVPHLQAVIWGNSMTRLQAKGGEGNVSLTGSVTLNYEHGQWAIWWPYAMLDAVMINNLIWRLDMTGQQKITAGSATTPQVALESATDGTNDPQQDFPLDVTTAWLKFSGMSGFQRLKRLVARVPISMGLAIQMYADYDLTTAVGASSWSAAETATVPQQQFEMHVAQQQCSAAAFRFTETGTFSSAMILQGLTLRGLRIGTQTKNLAAAGRK